MTGVKSQMPEDGKSRAEGRKAFESGEMIKSNPYPKMSVEYFEWLDGYIITDLIKTYQLARDK